MLESPTRKGPRWPVGGSAPAKRVVRCARLARRQGGFAVSRGQSHTFPSVSIGIALSTSSCGPFVRERDSPDPVAPPEKPSPGRCGGIRPMGRHRPADPQQRRWLPDNRSAGLWTVRLGAVEDPLLVSPFPFRQPGSVSGGAFRMGAVRPVACSVHQGGAASVGAREPVGCFGSRPVGYTGGGDEEVVSRGLAFPHQSGAGW